MNRRKFLQYGIGGVSTATLLAGCSASQTGEPTATRDGALRVATYSSFTGEGTAGTWLKSAFEEEHSDATVEFVTPENGFNQFIQRKQQGSPIDADLFVGLNTGELVRADQELDEQLLQQVEGGLSVSGSIKEGLQIDPQGRAVPYDTGYISLVYDEDEVQAPETFDALLESQYQDDLIAQNAQQSDPGRAFLLWSILAKGEDGYLDYWSSLIDNGVRVLSDWQPAYEAYMNGEAPMVVSYSTDQVYYHGEDVDMSRHQVGFLNNQGYANPETMAMFSDAENPDLAKQFMEFMLTAEAQAEIAVRNVQFPAIEGVTVSDEFDEYALEPPEAATFTYDDLTGNVEGWIDDWAQLVASN